ncbi:hypothetical protein B0H14DRAFT_2385904 [Mycena olivaceomarginata]|nr:hypothetical protein B0H14DRAFT_2385904 [Mycena olivaceomarginata]
MKYAKDTLKSSIEAKEGELAHLEEMLSAQQLFDKLSPLIHTRGQVLAVTTRIPEISRTVDAGTDVANISVTAWHDNPAATVLGLQVLEDCVVDAFHVILIAESLTLCAELKFQKKKVLAEQADVEMADATRPGPSIQSLIDKSVSAKNRSFQGF